MIYPLHPPSPSAFFLRGSTRGKGVEGNPSPPPPPPLNPRCHVRSSRTPPPPPVLLAGFHHEKASGERKQAARMGKGSPPEPYPSPAKACSPARMWGDGKQIPWSEVRDDGGGEKVWVPSIALGRDRGGFLSRPPAWAVGDLRTLIPKVLLLVMTRIDVMVTRWWCRSPPQRESPRKTWRVKNILVKLFF